MSLVGELLARGSLAQMSHKEELTQWLEGDVRSFYLGVDPTADSLHVGHLAALNMVRLLQKASHRVVLVLGGGTARIGDPSLKTELRSMLSGDEIKENGEKISAQLSSLVSLGEGLGEVVDNSTWLEDLNYLDFLSEIGRHFSVNRMLTAECFKNRLQKGLSFLEFNYMLLQSYDFYHLAKNRDVFLQIGGDDQWSNMLAGTDLIRRMLGKQAYVMTTPLLVTQGGVKMGKSEKGAVWLDAQKTPVLDFFQYFRNLSDGDVLAAYRSLTDLSSSDLKQWEEKLTAQAQARVWSEAKIELAYQLSVWVHGEEEATKTRELAGKLYGGGGEKEQAVDLMDPVLLPSSLLRERSGVPIGDLLVEGGVTTSKKEARRLILQGGISLAGEPCRDPAYLVAGSLLQGKGLVVRLGKKKFFLLKISSP